jgi:hypothetical protein
MMRYTVFKTRIQERKQYGRTDFADEAVARRKAVEAVFGK